ncbi:Na/Pi symporter [Methylophaga sp.]|nr:Na/Pi symporter [Methylophaga sp.]MBL1458801.1 Na/Pi cotransporter family protein [Methylophaga sp.]
MLNMLGSLIGGLGLFMLGMWLMSDGLKQIAGERLNQILKNWTNSRLRGLSAGFLLTAIIQHSGAVTLATIGFANAGILSLRRAMWIVFGSNVGTTVTGWLVVLIGFNLNIEHFALPLIGIGMAMRLLNSNRAYANIGLALTGFGLLFMGIAALKTTFSGADSLFDLHFSSGLLAIDIVMFALAGLILTTLLQSSSLTLTLALTSLAGGIIDLLPAAAIVIGSNLGSTTTAIFAVIGSQPVAKRIVASHVLFNLLTAIVSLILLVPLIWIIHWFQQLVVEDVQFTTTLVLFHTVFNLLGVALIWKLADPLENWLKTKFSATDENIAETKYLDNTTLKIPNLAITSIRLELIRLNKHVLKMVTHCIHKNRSISWLKQQHAFTEQNILKIGNFSHKLYQQHINEQIAEKTADLLRVSQYCDAISALTVAIAENRALSSHPIEAQLQQQLTNFNVDCLLLIDVSALDKSNPSLKNQLDSLEKTYLSLKSLLLRRGAEGRISIARMEKELQGISQLRRICQQAVKASLFFNNSQLDHALKQA